MQSYNEFRSFILNFTYVPTPFRKDFQNLTRMYKKTKNPVRKVKYFPRKSLKNRLAAHRTQNCQKNRKNHDIL